MNEKFLFFCLKDGWRDCHNNLNFKILTKMTATETKSHSLECNNSNKDQFTVISYAIFNTHCRIGDGYR